MAYIAHINITVKTVWCSSMDLDIGNYCKTNMAGNQKWRFKIYEHKTQMRHNPNGTKPTINTNFTSNDSLKVQIWSGKKGQPVAWAPACAGSEEGSDPLGSIVRSISLHFCKRLFPWLKPVTSLSVVTVQQLYHCAKAPLQFGCKILVNVMYLVASPFCRLFFNSIWDRIMMAAIRIMMAAKCLDDTAAFVFC